VPDPFGAPGDRMYRTGDLARYRGDGTLEFLGRKDHQVKVRGFRIELGEIENVLTAIEGVAEAVVLADEGRPGDKRLVAYLQPRPGSRLSQAGCVAALREKLPDYMVPADFVTVEALPLTAHNKIDRQALRRMAPSRDEARRFVEPSTALEQVIAQIWQDVLEAERVGVTDSFFDLGGHSLLATQVMWRVFEVFGVEVPLRRLFDSPTVAEFAAALEQAEGGSGRLARTAALYQTVRQLSADEVTQQLAAYDK
jgi:acyl carrier protein